MNSSFEKKKMMKDDINNDETLHHLNNAIT